MPGRLPTDICLLCGQAPADKTDSHIIPKMMTKNMFGSPRRGYVMGSHTSSRSRVVQDSAKESYLVCTRCEARFEKAETYIARKFFSRYRNPAFRAEFPITYRQMLIPKEPDIMALRNVDRGMMRLFSYSILWRAAVASIHGYGLFTLEQGIVETLRAELDGVLADREQDTLANCTQYAQTEPTFPYNMIGSAVKSDNTGNFMAPFDLEDGTALIIANEFIFNFYLRGQIQGNVVGYNLNVRYPEVSLLGLAEWSDFRTRMASIFAEARIRAMGKAA